MDAKKTFLFLILFFLIGVSSFFFTLFFLPPYTVGLLAAVLFYLSVFISSTCFFTLLGIGFRYLFANKFLVKSFLFTSFRQAFFISCVLLVTLFLMHKNSFSYTGFFLLILIFIFVEFFYLYFAKKLKGKNF